MPCLCPGAEPATVERKPHILPPTRRCQRSGIQFAPVARVQVLGLSEARPPYGVSVWPRDSFLACFCSIFYIFITEESTDRNLYGVRLGGGTARQLEPKAFAG